MPRYMHEFAETPREAFVRGVAEERARVVALLQERLTAMGEHAYLFQRDILDAVLLAWLALRLWLGVPAGAPTHCLDPAWRPEPKAPRPRKSRNPTTAPPNLAG